MKGKDIFQTRREQRGMSFVVSLLNLELYEIVKSVHDLVRVQGRDLHGR